MSTTTVVPAHLSYLAIYNPTLGPTDETVRDQIVFYYSHKHEVDLQRRAAERNATGGRNRPDSQQNAPTTADKRREEETEENEKLRQVGLAQGMVSFVK